VERGLGVNFLSHPFSCMFRWHAEVTESLAVELASYCWVRPHFSRCCSATLGQDQKKIFKGSQRGSVVGIQSSCKERPAHATFEEQEQTTTCTSFITPYWQGAWPPKRKGTSLCRLKESKYSMALHSNSYLYHYSIYAPFPHTSKRHRKVKREGGSEMRDHMCSQREKILAESAACNTTSRHTSPQLAKHL
jgi:hypothetical protein